MEVTDVKATSNKIKGEVKETFGKVTNDPKQQAEGKADKLKGATREKVGDLKEVISNKLDCSVDTTS